MRDKAKKIISHPLISSSSLVFLGLLLSNIFNFLFNLFMSRNLSVIDFGILASFISLITLSTLPAGSILPVMIRYAGLYFTNKKYGLLKGLYIKMFKVVFAVGMFFLLTFIVFSKQISYFFNIKNEFVIFMVGVIVFISFINVINVGFIQAKLSFRFYSLNVSFSTLIKFLIGFLFVGFGFGIYGAIWAIFFAFLLPYFMSFYPIRAIFFEKTEHYEENLSAMLAYGLPSAIATFGLTSLITTDVILSKHFLDPQQAGLYSGLSLIGRVIFFFSAPIGMVMFPLIVKQHTKGEKYQSTFLLSVLLILISSLVLTGFYFLFPKFAITFFLKKQEYFAVANILGLFGIFITLYSLISVFTSFYLSIKETKIYIPITIAAVAQAVLIALYHNTFLNIVIVSIAVSFVLFVYILFDYRKLYNKSNLKIEVESKPNIID